MRSRQITLKSCEEAAERIARDITDWRIRNDIPEDFPVTVYGVPRGGIAPAYMVVLTLIHRGWAPAYVVDDPVHADYIIDDIVDSGKTRERYKKAHPSKRFYPLFIRPDDAPYFDFPWELNEKGTVVDTDIPLRLLQYIGEDASRGGLVETPRRFLAAWRDHTSGYHINPADVLKVFEDGAEKCDEMVIVKGIPVYSHCEHHLAPFFGVVHIAYIPDGRVVGLSKLSRLSDVFAKRLQVQERLTTDISGALMEHLRPKGVAVVVECRHMCMESRGIQRQGAVTITSSMLGVFRDDDKARAEFLRLLK